MEKIHGNMHVFVLSCKFLTCKHKNMLVSTMEHLLQMLHEKIYDDVVDRLKKAYSRVKVGDPLDGELEYITPKPPCPSLLHTHTHTCTHMHTLTHTHKHTHIHTLTHTYTHMHTHAHTRTYIHTNLHAHTYTEGVLYGPLHSEAASKNYDHAIEDIKAQVQVYTCIIGT